MLNKNPLDNLRHSEDIDLVMKNGRVYDSMTLREIYPRRTRPPKLPFLGLMAAMGAGCMCQAPR